MVTGIDFFHFHFSVHVAVVNKINIGNFHLQEQQMHKQYEIEQQKPLAFCCLPAKTLNDKDHPLHNKKHQ